MPAVIRLVTHADVGGADTGHVSVSARHEAALDDGSRVLLLDDRGWSSTQAWDAATPEELRQTTRMVVGPDEPYGDRSQEDMETENWIFLRQVLHRHGVVVDVAELRRLPHDVVLSPRLLARIGAPPGSAVSRP